MANTRTSRTRTPVWIISKDRTVANVYTSEEAANTISNKGNVYDDKIPKSNFVAWESIAWKQNAVGVTLRISEEGESGIVGAAVYAVVVLRRLKNDREFV